MTSFSCGGCSIEFKKSQIKNHVRFSKICRGTLLACKECGKEFKGLQYRRHKECKPEADKSSAGNYERKSHVQKSIAIQEKWRQVVLESLKDIGISNRSQKEANKNLAKRSLPRIKEKFLHFVKMNEALVYYLGDGLDLFTVANEKWNKLENSTQPSTVTNSTEGIDKSTDSTENNQKPNKKRKLNNPLEGDL